jgi:hypothetical protein
MISVGARALTAIVAAAALVTALLTGGAALAVSGAPEVTGADYAFIARIQVGLPGESGSRGCTGALINTRFLLTAKSCFDGSAGAPTARTLVTVGGYSLPVVEVVPHPERDVALVRLAAELPAAVAPVGLGAQPPAAGDQVFVAGFGRTAGEWVPDQPHAAPVTVDAVGAGTLDVHADAGVSTCKGDAGGPAYTLSGGKPTLIGGKPTLIGLNGASWQQGCLGSDSSRSGAVEVRTDDLGAWISGQLRTRTSLDIFHSVGTKMCFGVNGAAKTVGARLVQWWCTDGPDHRWLPKALGGGSVQLVNDNSKLCMGVGTSSAVGSPVSQQACGGKGQQWTVDSAATGGIRYRNEQTNSCLAVPSSSTDPGVLLITWTCDDHVHPEQQWTIRSRDASRMLRNNKTAGCVRSGGADLAYVVDQENCKDYLPQRYSFPSNVSTTTIVNEGTARCLSVGGSSVKGAVIVQALCDGGSDQNWTIQRSTINSVPVIRFVNGLSGMCLGINGGHVEEGTKVLQWPCGADDHWFKA